MSEIHLSLSQVCIRSKGDYSHYRVLPEGIPASKLAVPCRNFIVHGKCYTVKSYSEKVLEVDLVIIGAKTITINVSYTPMSDAKMQCDRIFCPTKATLLVEPLRLTLDVQRRILYTYLHLSSSAPRRVLMRCMTRSFMVVD